MREDFDPSQNFFELTVPAQNIDYDPNPGEDATSETYPYPSHSPGDIGTDVIARVTWISSEEAGDVGAFVEELAITPS